MSLVGVTLLPVAKVDEGLQHRGIAGRSPGQGAGQARHFHRVLRMTPRPLLEHVGIKEIDILGNQRHPMALAVLVGTPPNHHRGEGRSIGQMLG